MGHHHDHSNTRNLKLAFFLNFAFTIIEIIGGILTNSLAILSDALHDLGDSFSLGMAWYLQKVSNKGRDQKYTYGYKRFSLLGALINCMVLIVGSIIIIKEAIPRLLNPEPTQAKGMFVLAILGIIINGVAVLQLRKGHSINERTVSLHMLEDVMGWVAILIGSIVIYFTNWFIIDPILSLCIAVLILLNTYKNIKPALRIILEGIPESISISEIEILLKGIPGVLDLHDLHVWSLDGERNILSVHLVTKSLDSEALFELKNEARRLLKEKGIGHATFEFEEENTLCEEICNDN